MKNCTFTLLPYFQTVNGATETQTPGWVRKARKAQRSLFLHGGSDLRLKMPYTAASINRMFPYLKPIAANALPLSPMGIEELNTLSGSVAPTPTPTPAPAFVPPEKLTFADAEMIRKDKETMSIKEIALKWNKGETTIRDIVKFKTFKAASITA